MNIEFYTTTLWIAVIWPLLLSLPALHNRLPWPRYLAIIPTVVLVVTPIDASINIPWLLYGTGFAIDGNLRWILSAMLVIWFATATITLPSKEKTPPHQSNTLYLLTLAGSLGAVLSTDLVGFFSFSTLMGYGFYGLLSQHTDKAQQQASRVYLYFLIAADLALFEALLLVAFTTQNFQYEIARQAMSDISVSPVYLYMVLLGFTLKAGIWPFYIWLTTAFNSATRTTLLLLIAGPITLSMLGLLRWLPAREDIYSIGIVMQLLGTAAILHTAIKLFKQLIFKQGLFSQGMGRVTTVWLLITFTGLYSLALGTALLNASLWQQYAYIAYPFIAAMNIALALLILITGKAQRKYALADITPLYIKKMFHVFKNWINAIQQLINYLVQTRKKLWNSLSSFVISRYQKAIKTRSFVADWKINITLFLILGLAISWLASYALK